MTIEETSSNYRVRVRAPEDFARESFRTITLRESPTVRAVIGRPRGARTTAIQSLIFPKDEWTRAEAQRWAAEHARRRNVDGYTDERGRFHPIRGSEGYDPTAVGEPSYAEQVRRAAIRTGRVRGDNMRLKRRNAYRNARRAHTINPRHRLRRRNDYDPMQRVEEIYREFLGRDPDSATAVLAPADAPEYLAALGIITEIVTDEGTYDFDVQDGFILAVDTRGNLWAIGENRMTPNEDLGEVHELSYVTQKDHLDGEVLEYYHTFGEDGGTRPHAYTDDDGFLRFAGGDYWITSAGIVN